MKLTVLFCCFFFCSFPLVAQDIWTATSTSDATAESMDIVMDAAGNSYIIGYISGNTEFQGIQVDMSTGYSDVIVSKINPQGIYEWAKRFSGPLSDRGSKIVLASNNDLIITGTFFGSIDFGETDLVAEAGSKDIFLARLTNSGDVIWARKDGGALGDNVFGLAVDSQDNIILTGQFEGTATIGGQTFNSMADPQTSLPTFDMFLVKFNGNGNPVWSKAAYAEYEDRGLAVACDNQNNIYLSGQFSDTINFFGQTINNPIYNTGFVSKFDPSGNNLWFNKLAASQLIAYDLAINHQNELLVTGDYLGQLVVWAQNIQHLLTNPYDKKIFLLKFGLNGSYIWGRAKGSNSEVSSRAVCVDQQDNIYIGGHFKCNFDEYRDSTGTAHWQSAGFRDQFVTKFTSLGATVWKNQVGGQRQDQCWGIDIHESDYPVITGSYISSLYFAYNTDYNPFDHFSNTNEQEYYTAFSYNEINFIHVFGEASVNIHTSKMIHSNSKYYNYYYMDGPNYSDSVPMHISPDEDSVDFCPPGLAGLQTNTDYDLGPLYEGSWNNGIDWNLGVGHETDGLYIVNVQRIDGCSSFGDTIYITYHPYPPLPFLTDDHGVNNQTAYYNDIIACAPDTLNFYFQGLCAGCSAEIAYLDTTRTLGLDSAYSIFEPSLIAVTVTSSMGCKVGWGFYYELVHDIDPYLLLNNDNDHNDSLMICRGTPVRVYIADSITNPTGLFQNHGEPVLSDSLTISFNGQHFQGTSDGHRIEFSPQQNGWYVIQQELVVGTTICPYPHQLLDSFYIEIKENPLFNIIGDSMFCPGEYSYLSVNPIIPGMLWEGPSIVWTSPDNDSIRVDQAGWYGVSGLYDYGEVSCPFWRSWHILEKEPPLILLEDGNICPGDSLLLSLTESGSAYEWIGPGGGTISQDSAIYASNPGFYACLFTDYDGCPLLTPPAEILGYTTPFLDVIPVNFICASEAVTLTAIFGGNAVVNWHSPITSTESSVEVNQPGTYSCEISQCGITTIDSVTVLDGSYELELNGPNVLCMGDTVTFQATPGLAAYEWSNGYSGVSFLEISEPGTYSVQTWNNFGCPAFSDTITITAYPESFAPAINDTFVCLGGNIDLAYQSEFDFGWYHQTTDSAPFSTQETISFTSLTEDTVVYIAHNSINCPLNFTEVTIDVLLPLTPPEISGDTTICEGDAAVFEVEAITNGTYSWVYDGDTISTQHSATIPNISSGSPLTIEIVLSDGCTDTQNEISFTVKYPSPISIDHTTDTLCYGEMLFATASGTGNIEFTWSDGASSWTGTNLSAGYNELSSGVVTVYGTNADGCHSEILSLEVAKSPDAELNITLDNISCEGSQLAISAVDSLGQITWILPDGSTEQSAYLLIESLSPGDEGLYVATLLNNFNCIIDDSVTIDVYERPFFTYVNDSVLCAEDVFDLTVPDLDYTFTWNNGLQSPTFTPKGEPVILTATDTNQCAYSDTVNILLVDCSGQAVNVITPNGDGVNEYFTIFNAEFAYDNCLIILNRWGNVVYEQNYYRNLFNGYTNEGKKLNDGVYYFLYYKDCSLKKEITHQGFFHIISE